MNANSNDHSSLNSVNTNLFNKGGSELLDTNTIKLLSKYEMEVLNVVKSSKKHGQGSFGYVTSAEVEFKKIKGDRTKRVITATKTFTDPDIMDNGISSDTIQESATYARILQSNNLAKGLFIKLNSGSQGLILEHYSMNLRQLFNPMQISWNRRDQLIRAIFFQIVSGLKELHSLGFIHKDLKADNILLSHDGRVLIGDFGLSTYLVKGSDVPQTFYFKQTTRTIEPPEGNNALQGHPIGQSYDIWSLGCILSSIIRRVDDFDLALILGPYWEKKVTIKDYQAAKKKIINYFDENLAGRNIKPSDIFLESAKDLLDKMLNIERPEARPTAENILKHKWFDGLTMTTAISIVRQSLPKATSGNAGRSKLIGTTRKINNSNANQHRNRNVSSYFQIMKQPVVSRFLNPELHADYAGALENLLNDMPVMFIQAGQRPRSCFYTYLHALEIFNRAVLKNVNFIRYLAVCLNIALKMSAEKDIFGFDYRAMQHYGEFESVDDYIQQEADIIRALNADTYPQVGGLVDTVMTKIRSSEDKVSVALKIVKKIFASSATFDEYVDINDGDEAYKSTEFSVKGLLEGFPRLSK